MYVKAMPWSQADFFALVCRSPKSQAKQVHWLSETAHGLCRLEDSGGWKKKAAVPLLARALAWEKAKKRRVKRFSSSLT